MTTTAPPAAPKSKYSMGTVANLMRSLLVVGVMVAVVFFMVPRVNTLSQPPVDVDTSAQSVLDTTHWPISVPTGLPDGWKPSSVRYVRSTGGLMTWHVGYVTPSGTYASLEQTKDATAEWVRAQTNRAPKTGTTDIDGVAWDTYVRDLKTQNSLVHAGDGAGMLTTIVTGDATVEDLTTFAQHLAPVTAG